jgi:acyl-CoA reductase-like NAD-dependent aldehyde dehydrogenase
MSLPITKTPKCYVGGAFIRSEGGAVLPIQDAEGQFFANIPQCTRKDLRNAVEAAGKAGAGWAKRTPYNRAQILYRLAEMIQPRSAELVRALSLTPQLSPDPEAEVSAAIERIVHYAGWADKYEQVLSCINPVATPHFNFTTTEPIGVIGVIAPGTAPLLGLLSLILPAITTGNAVIALASPAAPYAAILLGEMLAVSDLPGGVVNLLTGQRKDLIPTYATHEAIRAVIAAVSQEEAVVLQGGAADSVKRVTLHDEGADWFSAEFEGPYPLRDTLEAKTLWHPVGY